MGIVSAEFRRRAAESPAALPNGRERRHSGKSNRAEGCGGRNHSSSIAAAADPFTAPVHRPNMLIIY